MYTEGTNQPEATEDDLPHFWTALLFTIVQVVPHQTLLSIELGEQSTI